MGSLSKIPLAGPFLFWKYRMNEIENKFLLKNHAWNSFKTTRIYL